MSQENRARLSDSSHEGDGAASHDDSPRNLRKNPEQSLCTYKTYTLSGLARCLDLDIMEHDHQPGYGFGKVLVVRTYSGKELRVNQDDFNSGRGLVEAAIVRVMREKGWHDAHTFTHLESRQHIINSGRPYGSFPGDHYEEYVIRSRKIVGWHWQNRDFASLLNDEGAFAGNESEIPNTAYTYHDLNKRQVNQIIRHSDHYGIQARFTFSHAYAERAMAKVVARLHANEEGGLGVFVPRKDLQPMASGLEDHKTLDDLVCILRSWADNGDISMRQIRNRSCALSVSFGTVEGWEVDDPPASIKQKLKAILAGPWCADAAKECGITEKATLSYGGAVAPKYFTMLVSKVRWAIGFQTDEYILQRIHHAIFHQYEATRRHNFRDYWSAAVYFMAARARSLEVGYYSNQGKTKVVHPWQLPGFGLFPGSKVVQDLAVYNSDIGPRSAALDVQPGHAETAEEEEEDYYSTATSEEDEDSDAEYEGAEALWDDVD